MVDINKDSEEKEILQECCEENNVDFEEIKELMELEKEYETQTRRMWINWKIRALIVDQFCSD